MTEQIEELFVDCTPYQFAGICNGVASGFKTDDGVSFTVHNRSLRPSVGSSNAERIASVLPKPGESPIIIRIEAARRGQMRMRAIEIGEELTHVRVEEGGNAWHFYAFLVELIGELQRLGMTASAPPLRPDIESLTMRGSPLDFVNVCTALSLKASNFHLSNDGPIWVQKDTQTRVCFIERGERGEVICLDAVQLPGGLVQITIDWQSTDSAFRELVDLLRDELGSLGVLKSIPSHTSKDIMETTKEPKEDLATKEELELALRQVRQKHWQKAILMWRDYKNSTQIGEEIDRAPKTVLNNMTKFRDMLRETMGDAAAIRVIPYHYD